MPARETPRRLRRLSAAIIVILAALLWSHTATGNVRARPSLTAELGAPDADKTPLSIDRETLTFRCDQDGNRPYCDVDAVYEVTNPTDSLQTTEAHFVGFLTSRVRVTIDGEPVNADEPNAPGHGATPAHIWDFSNDVEQTEQWTAQWPFEVAVEPGKTVRMEVSGRMFPATSSRWSFGYARSPNRTRHDFLGRDLPIPEYEFRYLLSPIRTWAGDPDIAISVDYPDSWKVSVTFDRPDLPQPEPDVAEAGRRAFRVDADDVDQMTITAELPPPFPVHHAGPFARFGGNLDDANYWRIGAGYELAIGDKIFASVEAEWDFDRQWTITPLVTAASPNLLYVIPSFAVSAGPTFRVAPDFQAGGRIDLSAIWPVIGGPSLAFDYFPGLDTDDPRAFQVGLFWWVGF